MVSRIETNYIIWQNRSFRFYLAARLLYLNKQCSASAFCSIQAIELLMKSTLIYWDKSFDPREANHGIVSMLKNIKNKTEKGKDFCVPDYFFKDNRFQSVTRYPSDGRLVSIPKSLLNDLDNAFYDLVLLVPFQFNSELIWALSGENVNDIKILRRKNHKIRELRKYLNI